MTQAELQHIEHINKVLEEHQEIVNKVVNETEQLLNNYVPIVSAYVASLRDITVSFGASVTNIVQSTRQLGIVTSNTQDLGHFIAAIQKLDAILTPELIEKLQRISGHGEAKY